MTILDIIHFTYLIRFWCTLFSCSGGSLVAYADAGPTNGVPSIASTANVDEKKKKVVVLGTGWAGTSFLKNIKDPSYEVQVISPRNYFAFTPLLPSVTCGTVEARSIVEPIRNLVRKVIDFSAFVTMYWLYLKKAIRLENNGKEKHVSILSHV